jgi:hypothetical protein
MRAFFLACLAAAIIAIVGFAVLHNVQEPADVAFATSATRI